MKKSHGPDDLKDTTGRFYIGIPHFLTHTHPPKVLSILLLGPHLKIGDISQGSEGEGDVEDHAITQEAITSWPYNAPFVQKRVPMDHQGLTRLLCL